MRKAGQNKTSKQTKTTLKELPTDISCPKIQHIYILKTRLFEISFNAAGNSQWLDSD